MFVRVLLVLSFEFNLAFDVRIFFSVLKARSTVAAFAPSPIKDGLEICTGIESDASKLQRVFKSLRVSGGACVSLVEVRPSLLGRCCITRDGSVLVV